MENVKRITASLLQSIADALKEKRGTTDTIDAEDFGQILRSFKVGGVGTVEAPVTLMGESGERLISEYILQEVADELRRLYGETDLIPVAEYAPRILALDVVGFVGDEAEEETPAPAIALVGGMLKITGAGAAVFAVYIDSARFIDLPATNGMAAVDLKTLELAEGDHTIIVVSVSESGASSTASNTVTYKVSGEAEEENGGTTGGDTGDTGNGGTTGDGGDNESGGDTGDDEEETISAPTLGVLGDTLSITGAGADQYKIYVDGTERATSYAATFDLSTIGLKGGTYSITAISVSASGLASEASEAVTYTVKELIAPTVAIEDSVLTITGEGAEYYGIYTDGEKIASVPVNSPTYDLSVKNYVVGSYEITVKAGAMVNGMWRESVHSEAVTYWVLAPDAPRITISAGKTLVIIDDVNDKWNIYIDGVRRINGIMVKNISCTKTLGRDLNLPIGEYSITVKAVAGGEESSESNAEIYKVELSDEPVPAAPTVTYLGYYDEILAGYNSHHFKIESEEKVYSYKYTVTGTYETEGEYTLGDGSGFTSKQHKFAFSTNGTYYVSFAVCNRFGVYGEYSDPIQFITEDGVDRRPAPPTLAIDGDALSVTTSAAYDLRIYVDGVQCAYAHYNPSNTFFNALTINEFVSSYVPYGVHEITAKVKNYLGYWSDFSDPVYYGDEETAIYGQAKYGSVKYGGG